METDYKFVYLQDPDIQSVYPLETIVRYDHQESFKIILAIISTEIFSIKTISMENLVNFSFLDYFPVLTELMSTVNSTGWNGLPRHAGRVVKIEWPRSCSTPRFGLNADFWAN